MPRSSFIATLLPLAVPTAAEAHAHLLSATPAANSVTSRAPTIDLRFSERLVTKLSSATLLALPQAKPVPGAVRAGGDPRTLRFVPARPLAPGAYRVDYRVTSADTHRVTGAMTFRIK